MSPLLPPGVTVLADPAAVALRAAQEMVRLAQRCVSERGSFIVALSGGTTPKAMFELLAQDEDLHAGMPWWQTHFFWGDERHVPPDSEESNYHMAAQSMLTHSPTPPENIHRVYAELADAAEAARQYEQEIITTFTKLVRPRDPSPAFDLLLLGMGADGHTASLFPGTQALQESSRIFVENRVDKLDTTRLTITPPMIQAAEYVMLLVAGKDKADVLGKVLRGEYDPNVHPVQLVTQRAKPTVWLLDESASGLLK